ncbi:hypothetical protein Trydic_g2303 [Trypoxylus dichotomus]
MCSNSSLINVRNNKGPRLEPYGILEAKRAYFGHAAVVGYTKLSLMEVGLKQPKKRVATAKIAVFSKEYHGQCDQRLWIYLCVRRRVGRGHR